MMIAVFQAPGGPAIASDWLSSSVLDEAIDCSRSFNIFGCIVLGHGTSQYPSQDETFRSQGRQTTPPLWARRGLRRVYIKYVYWKKLRILNICFIQAPTKLQICNNADCLRPHNELGKQPVWDDARINHRGKFATPSFCPLLWTRSVSPCGLYTLPWLQIIHKTFPAKNKRTFLSLDEIHQQFAARFMVRNCVANSQSNP